MHGGDVAGLLGVGFSLVFTIGMIVFSLVITVISIAVPLGLVFLLFRAMAQSAAAEQKLLETGAPAPARVVSASETGVYINNRPQIRIVLEVAPPGEDAFTATISKVLSLVQIPRIQPGAVIEVRYDRADRSKVAIVGL